MPEIRQIRVGGVTYDVVSSESAEDVSQAQEYAQQAASSAAAAEASRQSMQADLSTYMRKGRDRVTAGQASGTNIGLNATAEGTNTMASAINSHAEGDNTTASGQASHAEGVRTTASGFISHAEGANTTASGQQSHAEGDSTVARGDYSHVEGNGTIAKGGSQHVFGDYNIEDPSTAPDINSFNHGDYIEIVGNGSNNEHRSNARTLDWSGNEVLGGRLTLGAQPIDNMDAVTKEYADNIAAQGAVIPSQTGNAGKFLATNGSTAYWVKNYVTAGQLEGTTLGTNVTAEGVNTTASGNYSHAEGDSTVASGYASHAEGEITVASGSRSHAEGEGTIANHRSQHVFGTFNIADSNANPQYVKGDYIEIVGNGPNEDSRSNARTLDWYGNEVLAGTLTVGRNPTQDMGVVTKKYVDDAYVIAGQKSGTTLGSSATAEGSNTTSSGYASHAEGSQTTASKNYSHAEGYLSTASGQGAHAEGISTTASGQASHTEGEDTTAGGRDSHAEGNGATASGDYSHAEGRNTTASGSESHAEGVGATASGDWGSHAEGSQTIASGSASHAEGWTTTASGGESHAEGLSTIASGPMSHAEGWGTVANHKSQHVFGEYNIEDTNSATSANRGDYVEIVGNGTGDYYNRSNARTLDWNGNEVLAGKLTLGAQPTANMDAATKQYVDAAVAGGGGGQTGVASVNGQAGNVILTASDVGAMPDTFLESDPTVPSWAKEPNKPTYTAEEVGALPDGASITGKNLLDNAWFTVRQKGDGPFTSGRTADRWMIRGGTNVAVTLRSPYGINVEADILALDQYIDIPSSFCEGKVFTLSALCNGVVYSGTGVFSTSQYSIDFTVSNVHFRFGLFSDPVVPFVRINILSGAAANLAIDAVKLELGSYSTLANDIPPNRGVELTKCITSTADSTDPYANTGFGRSNRNLLDNPWFRIDQRSVSGTITSGYIADRWTITYGSGGVQASRTEDTITVKSTSGSSHGDIAQRMEKSLFDFLVGKTVTASVMRSDGSVISKSFIFQSAVGSINVGTDLDGNTISVRVYQTSTYQDVQFWKWNTVGTFRAVKLELGSYSTLANDTPPDYKTELDKCQYYCRVIQGNTYSAVGVAVAATSIRVPFPYTMRTKPSIATTGSFSFYGSSSSLTASSVVVGGGESKDFLHLNFTVSGATTWQPYLMLPATGTSIVLSADL